MTIIPDGFLSQLPFAAFRDKEGKYLIEKHPISFAPSLKVLELLSQMPKDFTQNSLVIGNPTTPNAQDTLAEAARETTKIVADLLNTPLERVLLRGDPTPSRFMQEAIRANYIHLVCHGITGEKPEEKFDPLSVFEGFFKLAADEEHPKGYLHAQEIASLSLHTNLVFMNSCFSGRGKLQKEGVIGPAWSFLAAGALSTVATYWRLPDTELTVQMVETFYRHLLGKDAKKLNKAQSLRQAMLKGIDQKREDPRAWGSLFLSGLVEYDDTIK